MRTSAGSVGVGCVRERRARWGTDAFAELNVVRHLSFTVFLIVAHFLLVVSEWLVCFLVSSAVAFFRLELLWFRGGRVADKGVRVTLPHSHAVFPRSGTVPLALIHYVWFAPSGTFLENGSDTLIWFGEISMAGSSFGVTVVRLSSRPAWIVCLVTGCCFVL